MNLVAELLARERRQHLVRVHVRRGSRTGLEHVDWELRIPRALDDFTSRSGDGLGDLTIEAAQRRVLQCSSTFDATERAHERDFDTNTRDGKVLNRSLGLCGPFRVCRDSDVPHGVTLDA